MKNYFLSIFIILATGLYSQTRIEILIKDSKSKEPLAFCNVAVESTNRGGITNADGVIQLTVETLKDIVVISYLGYKSKSLVAGQLISKREVLLEKNVFAIQEVNVVSDDSYLYDIVSKCRKTILKNNYKSNSKVYYGLETESKGQPIELLECYYNADINGTNIDELYFKNGRVALSTMDDNYFLSRGSSNAILQIDISHDNGNFPAIPLQMNLRKMKKWFKIELMYMDKEVYQLKFSPRDTNNECFSGEMWIERNSFDILKINYKINQTRIHPFLPMFPMDSISDISFSISNTFKQEGEHKVLDYINFEYQLTYKSVRDTPQILNHSNKIRPITTKGVIFFYDYNKPFILPYFDYDNNLDDYRRLSIIPYNEIFWRDNNQFVLTVKQKENLGFIAHNGQLINFNSFSFTDGFEINRGRDKGASNFYSDYYSFWSAKKRINISREQNENTKTYSKDIINKSIQSDLYQLEVQILLDITKIGDSLHCQSYTVFDSFKTFYHLPQQSYTRIFLNIYFDLCEIERRKMQKQLDSKQLSKKEIDVIYNTSLKKIETTTQQYFKEVKLGENYISLKKWNKYVFEQLKIDNIQLVSNTDKSK